MNKLEQTSTFITLIVTIILQYVVICLGCMLLFIQQTSQSHRQKEAIQHLLNRLPHCVDLQSHIFKIKSISNLDTWTCVGVCYHRE